MSTEEIGGLLIRELIVRCAEAIIGFSYVVAGVAPCNSLREQSQTVLDVLFLLSADFLVVLNRWRRVSLLELVDSPRDDLIASALIRPTGLLSLTVIASRLHSSHLIFLASLTLCDSPRCD